MTSPTNPPLLPLAEGALFHAIFLHSPVAMALSRVRDGVIVEVNQEWVQLTGFSRSEAIGSTALGLGHWADQDLRESLMQALRNKGRFSDVDVTLLMRDGQARLVCMSAAMVDVLGEPYIVVYLRDVTSERLAQESLRAGERTLEQTNEKLNRQVKLYEMTEAVAKVGHWVVYPGESMVHLSRGYSDIGKLGNVREVPIGEHLQRVHPDELDAVKRALKRMDGEIVEHRWCQPSGAWIWLRMRMHRQVEHGVVKADFAIVQDISAEREAVQALAQQLVATQASEARFRSLTELSSDWYWEQDETYRFVRLDGNLKQANALPIENYIGSTRWESGGQGVSAAQWAAHKATLEAHEVFHDFEMQRIRQDGTPMWISVNGTPVLMRRAGSVVTVAPLTILMPASSRSPILSAWRFTMYSPVCPIAACCWTD